MDELEALELEGLDVFEDLGNIEGLGEPENEEEFSLCIQPSQFAPGDAKSLPGSPLT